MKLTLDQVSVELGARRIVRDIDLCVAAGEVVGLIGPNGSGKSTLLRSVYRVLRPVAGRVLLDSDDVWALSARESAIRTGVVVQEAPSDFDFSVIEVIQMGRTPHKGLLARDTAADARVCAAALERVGLGGFAERDYNTLSGGEKQRVLVARALAQEPRLLVLDEPTNHLDIHYQLELLELVRGLGLTTLITLHDLNLAAAYCDRLYLLADGRIVAAGSTAEVLTADHLRRIFKVEARVGRHPLTGRPQLSFASLR